MSDAMSQGYEMSLQEEERRKGFFEVQTVDDWGNIGYYLEAKKTSAGTWSHADQDQSKRLKAGDKILVLFPDSVIEEHIVKSAPYTAHINDMGHDYTVKTETLYIVCNLHGLKVDVSVGKLKVKRAP